MGYLDNAGLSRMWDKIKTYLSSNYKPKQTAKSSPSASSTDVAFIDTISQDANGVITATKKTVRSASTSQSGLCPQLAGGTTKFLRADGSWAVPSGSGGSPNIQILTQDKSFTSTSERVSLSSGTTSKTVLSVTAPFDGYAVIAGNVTMTTNSSGNRNVSVSVAGTTIDQDTRAAHSTNNGNLGIAAVASVSSGDVVAIQVWQSSGSTLYGGGHLGVMFIEA